MQISKQKYKTLVSDMRLDAEAYMPIYIEIEKILKCKKCTTLGKEVKSYKKGIFDINAECYCDANYPNAIPFVRILNLKNMIIDTADIAYIPIEEHKKNINTSLLKNDLILSKTAIPACSLVTVLECNTSQDTIAVRLKNDSSLKSPFLVVFLNSYYGKNQMKRWFTGNIQMHLNLTDSKTIIVPILKEIFQTFITKIFEESLTLNNKSNSLYLESKNLLLSELGLINWQPKHKLCSIKKYSEVKNSSRFDAEYFQPKYDEIIEIINKNNHTTLSEQFDIIRNNGLKYVSEGKNGVIKTKQIKDRFIDFNVEDRTNQDDSNIVVKNRDVLFASMGVGSLGKANIYYNFEDEDKYIIDSTLKIFRAKIKSTISPEYLEVYLHSLLAQELIYQNIVGSSGIISIYESYLQRLPIPIIDKKAEEQIIENVKNAHLFNYQSKQLLELAQRGVEIAIEENEDFATNWINEQLSEIGVKL